CAPTAAAEVGVFTALERGASSARGLARRLSLHEGTLESLCRVLVSRGALSLRDGKFALTRATRLFRLRTSPFYRGPETAGLRRAMEHRELVNALRAKGASRPLSDAWRAGTLSAEDALDFTIVMHSI